MMQYSYKLTACIPKIFLIACAEPELYDVQIYNYNNLTTYTV